VVSFKLKEDRFTLDIRKNEICSCEGDETLEQVAQRSCGCPLPGNIQVQVGRAFEQPGLVEGVLAHSSGVGNG